jgi:hypothetical protein
MLKYHAKKVCGKWRFLIFSGPCIVIYCTVHRDIFL